MNMEQSEKLIAEIKKHSVLYDISSPGYKNGRVKNKAWSDVSKKVYNRTDAQTISKAKERWKSLRDAYVKARRVKVSSIKGKRTAKHLRRSFRYYEALNFLAPHLKNIALRPSMGEKSEEENASEEDGQDNEENIQPRVSTKHVKREREEAESSEEEDIDVEEDEDETERTRPVEPKSKKLRRSMEAMNTIIDFVQNNKSERQTAPVQELDSFFKGISDTVKSLDPVNQVLAQKHIANLVLDYKLREVEGRDSESRSIGSSRISSQERRINTNSQSSDTKELFRMDHSS